MVTINPADCPPDRAYMGTVNGRREVMRRFPGRELPWETFANVHADASVSDLVPLVEARPITRDDLPIVRLPLGTGTEVHRAVDHHRAEVVEHINDRGGLGLDAREPLERALRERDSLRCDLDWARGKCDELRSLIRGQRENVAQAQRERDEADRRTAAAEAERDRWKLHHDRVDGQWAKAEREVTRLRGTGAVSKADIEEAVRSVAVNPIWEAATRKIIDAVWALHEGTEGDITPKSASEWHDETGAHWNCFPFVRQKGEDVKIGTRSEHVYTVNAAEAREFARCVLGAAIEAEQSVDRVAELAAQIESSAREIVQSAVNALAGITGEEVRVDVDGLLADVHPDEWRQMARHALEQDASSDE